MASHSALVGGQKIEDNPFTILRHFQKERGRVRADASRQPRLLSDTLPSFPFFRSSYGSTESPPRPAIRNAAFRLRFALFLPLCTAHPRPRANLLRLATPLRLAILRSSEVWQAGQQADLS